MMWKNINYMFLSKISRNQHDPIFFIENICAHTDKM